MHSFVGRGLGKRFYRNWIFKDQSFSLHPGDKLLLTGPNGSGKSTLMRIMAGQLTPTEGKLSFAIGKRQIPFESYYKYFSWAGPYMDLYADLTLAESIRMHFRFKRPLIKIEEVPAVLMLDAHLDKPLRHFSSGMLHRVKTGLAILSDCKVLLLDEATTNMDQQNSELVFEWLDSYLGERSLIFASNNDAEFHRFEQRLDLLPFH